MEMAEPKFVSIRVIGVWLFLIRVYPCASVVNPFRLRETLDFTSFSTTAKMEQQQLIRFE